MADLTSQLHALRRSYKRLASGASTETERRKADLLCANIVRALRNGTVNAEFVAGVAEGFGQVSGEGPSSPDSPSGTGENHGGAYERVRVSLERPRRRDVFGSYRRSGSAEATLSDTERAVLRRLRSGLSVREVAKDLSVTTTAVGRIAMKLGKLKLLAEVSDSRPESTTS